MRTLFDFMFGKYLVVQKLLSQFLKTDSRRVHVTPRAGPPSLRAEELGLPGTF